MIHHTVQLSHSVLAVSEGYLYNTIPKSLSVWCLNIYISRA